MSSDCMEWNCRLHAYNTRTNWPLQIGHTCAMCQIHMNFNQRSDHQAFQTFITQLLQLNRPCARGRSNLPLFVPPADAVASLGHALRLSMSTQLTPTGQS